MFEAFNVPAMNVAIQAVLSLYASGVPLVLSWTLVMVGLTAGQAMKVTHCLMPFSDWTWLIVTRPCTS